MKINSGIRRHLRKWLLKGDNVYCPCCERSSFAFWPFGSPVRYNAACPGCGSLERHRLIWLFLSHNNLLSGIKDKNPVHLLHVAPEAIFLNVL